MEANKPNKKSWVYDIDACKSKFYDLIEKYGGKAPEKFQEMIDEELRDILFK